MRITVIGAEGQLGSDLRRRLTGEVVGFDVPAIDVCDPPSLESTLSRSRPDVIINCAAMTNVDACETETNTAFQVNAGGALNVARVADQLGAALVYISTDYVFGGEPDATGPYDELSRPAPTCVYGASKLAGEALTRAYCRRSYIVRTCGLYGRAGARGKGGNFVETMIKLATGDAPVRVVADQRLSPTSTWALADRLNRLIQTDAFGLVHLAAEDSCTWHEFAERIVHTVDPDRDVTPIRTDEFPRPAPRPAMSAIVSSRLCDLGIPTCGTWRAMLDEYLQQRQEPQPTDQ